MRGFYLFILIFAAATMAAAQTVNTSSVAGTVTGFDGKPAVGAIVEVRCDSSAEKHYMVSTDNRGRFEITVPTGACSIKASKDTNDSTYFSLEKAIEPDSTNAITVDLFLTASSFIREEVEIRIAAATVQPFAEVAKTVSVIDILEIQNRNEISVSDALRTVPGFRIQQLGGTGRTASVKTRGLRNQDTAVLLDGQRLRDPSSITGDASSFISDLNLVNVDRIEVLRGSGSSVYGTNAIGGVIDIQTQKPERGFQGRFLGEYGGLGYSRFEGGGSYGSSGDRFGLSGGVSRFGVTKGIDGEDDANAASFRVRVDAKPFEGGSFSGRIYYSDAFVRLNANPDTLGMQPNTSIIKAAEGVNFVRDANDPDNFQHTGLFSGQLGASFAFGPRTVVTGFYQALKTSRENDNGRLGPGFQPFGGTQSSFFDGQIHTLNGKLDWEASETGRLISGYEFELERYRSEGLGPAAFDAFRTEADQSSNTFFAQYLSSIAERRLQIAGGFRLQAFRLSSPVFSEANGPYGGVVLENPPAAVTFDGAVSYYFPRSNTKIRGHAGNGYRVPSLYERFGSFYSSFSRSFIALGDPLLKPERSAAFDAGFDQLLFDGRMDLSGTFFYTRLTDTIGYANTAADIGSTRRLFGGYRNVKGGVARGIEIASRLLPFDTTSLFVSYTYTNSDQSEPQVAGSGIIETLGIPSRSFTLNATQFIGSRMSVNFDFEATSDYLAPIFSSTNFSTYVYRFGGHRRGDLSMNYRLPLFGGRTNVTIFTTMENVFGSKYFENGFATTGRTARAGIGLTF